MSARLSTSILALTLTACAATTPAAPSHDATHVPSSAPGDMMGATGSSRNELTKQASAFEFTIESGVTDVRRAQPTTLVFRIDRDRKVMKDFKVAHEKLLHFIVVRNNLAHFQHLHPDLDPSTGRFTIPMTFPVDGTYALFADFEPQEGEATVLRKEVTIGSASMQTALAADTTAQEADGYIVTPTVGSPLPTGREQLFIFGITKNGNAVTDLQNYLGAKGHAVILKEGSLDFFHGHPSEQGGGHGGMVTPGPGEVIFMASLPEPGTYRIFQQYRPEGNLITVANTYEVVSPPSDVSTGSDLEGEGPTKELSMEAFQWGFEPATIRVKEGTALRIRLTTRDVPHGFNIAEFGVSETILPGKTTTAIFTADKKGTYVFGCDVACGKNHDEMAENGGTLIVE